MKNNGLITMSVKSCNSTCDGLANCCFNTLSKYGATYHYGNYGLDLVSGLLANTSPISINLF